MSDDARPHRGVAARRTPERRSRGWASSPTRASASAARRARSRARSGTRCPRTGSLFTGDSYDNTGGLGANTWRHVAFIEQERPLRVPTTARGRRRRVPLADELGRVQALHPLGLPRRVPDRRDHPHRVRHGRRAGGRLQRLRLLRPGVPVRRARPARDRGRRPRLEVHALLRPHARGHDARLRAGVSRPSRSSTARSTSCARAPSRTAREGRRGRLRGRAPLRARSRPTASAASARSSCSSTSPRCTACRPTRSTRPATCRRCGGPPRVAAGALALTAALRRVIGRPAMSRSAGHRLLRPADRQAAGVEATRSPGTCSPAAWPAARRRWRSPPG